MTEEDIIEQFLDSFEKIYTFLRPHSIEERKAVKTVANIIKDSSVTQDMFANSALIIISLLTQNGKTFCLQTEVESIFLWKYENHQNKFIDKNNGALTILDACGFIKKGNQAPDRRLKTITLTERGLERIEELRKSRRKDAVVIISKLGIRNPEFYPYTKVVEGIATLADNLWKEVKTKANSEVKPVSSINK